MLIIQKAALAIDANGLHYGALTLAQVRGGMLKPRPAAFARLVYLGAPELGPPSPGWLRYLEIVRMAKAGFDPSQPRDDQGMWTSEGGSAPRQPVTVTPQGGAGTLNDGVYHTTSGDDGKPVLPQAIPVQAEIPGEEDPAGEEKEREDGILG